jgi:hypothetical protein
MSSEKDPGALAGATGAGGDEARDQELPYTTEDPARPGTTDPEDQHPLPWLANLSPAEYESMRRRMAREYGWRVAFLDRLYRQARRKAGLR